jgi:hypothetical protein
LNFIFSNVFTLRYFENSFIVFMFLALMRKSEFLIVLCVIGLKMSFSETG